MHKSQLHFAKLFSVVHHPSYHFFLFATRERRCARGRARTRAAAASPSDGILFLSGPGPAPGRTLHTPAQAAATEPRTLNASCSAEHRFLQNSRRTAAAM